MDYTIAEELKNVHDYFNAMSNAGKLPTARVSVMINSYAVMRAAKMSAGTVGASEPGVFVDPSDLLSEDDNGEDDPLVVVDDDPSSEEEHDVDDIRAEEVISYMKESQVDGAESARTPSKDPDEFPY